MAEAPSPIAGETAAPADTLGYPPTYASMAEARRARKHKLTAALRLFGRFGFDEGVAGHFTVRDPEQTDHFWVNPFGRIVQADAGLRSGTGEPCR